MQDGCPEGLDPEMLKFFSYIWDAQHTARAKIVASVGPVPVGLVFIPLRHAREVGEFLKNLRV